MMTMDQASPSQAPQAPNDELELVSMYLALPVEGGHGLALHLGPETRGIRQGTLTIDPNICGLDEWGDRTWCTRMATRTIDVTITRVETRDPAGRSRVLHHLESPALMAESFDLVEDPEAGLWTVVYTPGKEDRTRVVPLFSAELFSLDPGRGVAMPQPREPEQG